MNECGRTNRKECKGGGVVFNIKNKRISQTMGREKKGREKREREKKGEKKKERDHGDQTTD